MDINNSNQERPKRKVTKRTKVQVPDSAFEIKAKFWQSPAWELVREIAQFVSTTGLAHMHPAITYGQVLKGSQVMFLEVFDLVQKFATRDDDWCLCAVCWHHYPQFKNHGVIAWFPDEGTIKIMGWDCYKALDPEGHAAAAAQFRLDEAQRSNERYLISRLPQVPILLADLEWDLAIAKAMVALRAAFVSALARQGLEDLPNHMKTGELLVFRGDGAEPSQAENDTTIRYAKIDGFALIGKSGLPLARDIEQARSAMRELKFGKGWEQKLASMSQQQMAKIAKLFGNALKSWETARSEIADRQLFISPEVGRTIQTWSDLPNATLRFYFEYDHERIKLGLSPSRCEIVEIPLQARERLSTLPDLTPNRKH